LVRARNAKTLALTALKNLLGIEGRSIEVPADPIEINAPAPGSLGDRPELLALSFRHEAAQENIRKARGGYLPQVDAFGHVDHDEGWKFNDSGNSYALGVVARWDLWDGQLTRNRVREAESNLDVIREHERKLRLQIQFEVEQAQLQFAEANERLSVAQQTVLQAEESVKLTR